MLYSGRTLYHWKLQCSEALFRKDIISLGATVFWCFIQDGHCIIGSYSVLMLYSGRILYHWELQCSRVLYRKDVVLLVATVFPCFIQEGYCIIGSYSVLMLYAGRTLYHWKLQCSRVLYRKDVVSLEATVFWCFIQEGYCIIWELQCSLSYVCRYQATKYREQQRPRVVRSIGAVRRVLQRARSSVPPKLNVQVQGDGWRGAETPVSPWVPQRVASRRRSQTVSAKFVWEEISFGAAGRYFSFDQPFLELQSAFFRCLRYHIECIDLSFDL
jgi:hypothetical protein